LCTMIDNPSFNVKAYQKGENIALFFTKIGDKLVM